MELDPLTTLLEIINFLVLIWLLKRFLFKPVQAAIARRQQELQQAQQNALQQQQDAAALQQQLQTQLEDWEQEKSRQQQDLQHQIAQQREQALSKVKQEAEAEKTRLQSILEQDRAALAQKTQLQARQGALQLTRQLLQRLAGTDLDQALLNMLLQDLKQLPEEDREKLDSALQKQALVRMTSARPLSEQSNQTLRTALSDLFGQSITVETAVDSSLISGLRLSVGSLILHANLTDELDFFKAELEHVV